ncbi:MAG: hypothetical protein WBA25_19740 [Jannaschia sp.]
MFVTQSALGQNQWWRYAVTMLVTVITFVASHIPLFIVINTYAKKGGFSDADLDRLLTSGRLGQIGVSSNLALIVMLLPFAVVLITLLLCVRLFTRAKGCLF